MGTGCFTTTQNNTGADCARVVFSQEGGNSVDENEKKVSQEEILRAREEEFARREAQLAEREKQLQDKEARNLKENFYENFRKVPVRYLDYLIGGCVIAIVACVVLGMLKGRGLL